MQAAVVSVLLVSASLGQARFAGPPERFYGYGTIRKDELEQQQTSFKQWWGDELVMKLADLPAEGKVPEFRVPYSGHDYPDRAGGTVFALSKYDQAFHRGRQMATDFERMDVSAHRGGRPPSRGVEPGFGGGLFARLRANAERGRVPTWYGHCNGWTAAAIRHAEPQKSVVRNGVTFTPADIKGLLAEIYMYSDSEFLGGVDPAINPAVLHMTLGNWLGRGSHPVGMETAVGEVVINFPVFNYKSQINKLNSRESDVKTWITYTLNINRELDKGPPNYHRQMYFHYVLDLDEIGAIRGGRYVGDSQQIDMLWTPLKPAQGGDERNRRGNPHLDIKEVLAIWRESVPDDLRKKWLNIDPTEEDRLLPPSEAVAANEKPAEGASGEATSAATATSASGEAVASTSEPTAAAASSSSATTSDTTRSDGAAGSSTSAGGATP
jgi:Transglutaminase elicitor